MSERKTVTPWGSAAVVEEVRIPQRAGEKRFSACFQLLEIGSGERLVRIAYATTGNGRRGPVTLRRGDLARLQGMLERRPDLAAALGPLGKEGVPSLVS